VAPAERPVQSSRAADWLAGASLAAIAAALYLPRLLPSSGFSPDTMKYHYIGAVLGISHAPGSPFYILVTWVIAHMPVGELAWRLNLFSAVSAAAAAIFLYLFARELARSRMAGFASAVALLVASIFWEQSIVAEVYTFHAALLVASAWLLVRWERTDATRDLGVAALAYGLSFGVHLMSWYLLPGWIALVLAGPRSVLRRPRNAAVVAAGALAGLCTYLYYAIRPAMAPRYVEVNIDGAGAFFDYITGGDFKRRMFAYDIDTMAGDRWPWFLGLLRDNAGWPLVALGSIGLVMLARRNGRLAVLVGPPIALGAWYAMGYAVGDARVFALPAFCMLFAAAAVGLEGVASSARPWVPSRRAAVVSVVMIAGVAIERSDDVARNAVVLDRSDDTRYAGYAEHILTSVERGSTIVAGSDWIFHALAYQHWGRGLRANGRLFLQTAEPAGCEATRRALELYLARGPVYATTGLTACVDGVYDVESEDLSRTLAEYLSSVRVGRLVALATHDAGAGGLDDASWRQLEALDALRGWRSRPDQAYAALLVRTPTGFAGVERQGEGGAALGVGRGDPMAPGMSAPFDVAIASGAQSSGRPTTLVVDGIDYAQPHRGLQIVVFDPGTGLALDRRVVETHRTASLREFSYFRVRARRD
jgi:hypothetical protein